MRRVVGALAALAISTSVASAQDPSVPFSWTGIYVGAGIGGGAAVHEQSLNLSGLGTVFTDSSAAQGFLGRCRRLRFSGEAGTSLLASFFDYDLSNISTRMRTLSDPLPFCHHKHSWAAGRPRRLSCDPGHAFVLGRPDIHARAFISTRSAASISAGISWAAASKPSLPAIGRCAANIASRHSSTETVLDCAVSAATRSKPKRRCTRGRLMLIYRFGSGAATQP